MSFQNNKVKFVTEGGKGADTSQKSPPPLNICIVINVLYYLKPFSRLIIVAEPLDKIGTEIERITFLLLKNILTLLDSGKNDPINIYPFLEKFCQYVTSTVSQFNELDIAFVWDNIIKLITVVIPPLREVFLGRISSNFDVNGWLNLASRCFHAQFNHPHQSLEELIRAFFVDPNAGDDDCSPSEKGSKGHKHSAHLARTCNANVLQRAPEILVFSIESAHLPVLPKSTMDGAGKAVMKAKACTEIRFPVSFDLSQFISPLAPAKTDSLTADGAAALSKIYDLTSVVSLEGQSFETVQAYYRVFEDESANGKWYRGSGANHEEVDRSRVVERNFFDISNNNADPAIPKVHPRLLIYVKRGILKLSNRLMEYVSRAGQMRSLGDSAFDNAETPEHYDEAKHYYEEALAYDESLKSALQDRMHTLEQIERNQKAQSYENQGDISLGKRRFKEAGDLYKIASRCANVHGSSFARIREKEEYVMKILNLEIANHLAEKGEDFLKNGMLTQGREQFVQALKLNPEYLHLQSIIAGIDRTITTQTSAVKVNEGNQAMRIGKYKHANTLFQEAILLVPERAIVLKPLLDSLVVLMQGEDALMKQRSGLVALEDKKYATAIVLITEAISLLPAESVTEHAFFLCDRAQVYFEMKDYVTSIADCHAALELRPELAIAFLRLGAAQFELEQYDEATASYEKAIRNDPSLGEQVKVKVRQVNTAKEVLQRKEREAERARLKEEERKQLEERRALEQQLKKEKAEKLAIEQAEKAERNRIKEEEKKAKLLKEKEMQAEAEKAKEIEKERLRLEKVERDAQRALEREKARAEKEVQREKARLDKERAARILAEAKKEEEQRQKEFVAEIERAEARAREVEREKEAEKEKARQDRERIIAEREKARQEKLADGSTKKSKEVPAVTNKNAASSVAGNPYVPSSSSAVSGSSTSRSSSSTVTTAPSHTSFSSVATASISAPVEAFPTLGGSVPAGGKTNSWAPLPSNRAVPPTTTPTAGGVNTKWSSLVSGPEDDMSTPTKQSQAQKGTPAKKITIMARPSQQTAQQGNDFPAMGQDPPPAPQTVPKTPTSYLDKNVQSDIALGAKIGSAWANHELAMLEATADLISTTKTTPKPTAPVPPVAPSAISMPPPLPLSTSNSLSFVPSQSNDSHLFSGVGGGTDSSAYSSLFTSSGDNYLGISRPGEKSLLSDVSPMMSKLGFGSKDNLNLFAQQAPNASSGGDSFSLDYNQGASLNFGGIASNNSSLGLFSGVGGGGNANNDSSLFLDLGGGFGDDFGLGGSGLGGGDAVLGGMSLGLGSGSAAKASNEESLFMNSFMSSNASNKLAENPLSLNSPSNTFGLLGAVEELPMDFNQLLFTDSNKDINLGLGGGLAGGLGSVQSATSTSRLSSFLGASNNDPLSLNGGNNFGLNFASSSDASLLGGSSNFLASNRGISAPEPLRAQAPLPYLNAPGLSPATSLGGKVNLTSPALPTPPPQLAPVLPAPVGQQSGIDSDVLAENVYPSVSWLRQYNMHMYRWSGDSKEWTEFAMHLPPQTIQVVAGVNNVNLTEITRLSQCAVWLDEEWLGGSKEKFLVFKRGSSGQPSNAAMINALEVVSNIMKQYLKSQTALPLSRGGSSTNSLNTKASQQYSAQTQHYGAENDFDLIGGGVGADLDFLEIYSSDEDASSTKSFQLTPRTLALQATLSPPMIKKDRPALLKITPNSAGQVHRTLEIPRDVVGLIIGQAGKKIKDLCSGSGAKIQFRQNKTAERDRRPATLEVSGTFDSVDRALALIWDTLQQLGKEYNEVPHVTKTK